MASPDAPNNNNNETHPLLANYVERQNEREENTESERSSNISFLRWTTCDEIRRCSCAVLSFILMAALVGSGLVLFWFLWAWFVLYLHLPGVLTPIVWLAGFLLPLCAFKLFQSCPRCTRACFAQPLVPPDINAWKTHHLWNQRRQFGMSIYRYTPLPLSIAEMVSDFCFHSEILVTTNKNKLVGIYPDTASLETVAEFSKNITDLAIANGNIHKVYVLMCREMQKTAIDCRDRLGCDGGDEDERGARDGANHGGGNTGNTTNANNNNTGNAANGNGSLLSSIPSWLWEPKQHVDMMIAEYDIAKGTLVQHSSKFNFEQISVTTMQQLRGIYYKPSYRLMIDHERDILVVSRDGDFITFDSQTLTVLNKREIIAHPENRDDREQFVHLREYRWNAARIVPAKVVKLIMNIVSQVEGTQTAYLYNASHVYCVVPFGHHALFICNINTGWLRYLDFSHVDPISDTQIHYVEFSIDHQYLYLCCTQTLSVLSTRNFQPIITVPFTKLDYTMPCGLIRTPPTENQILLMLAKHRQKLLQEIREKHEQNLLQNNASPSPPLAQDPQYHDLIKRSQENYKLSLTKKLESIALVFASTRVFMDPRIFLYRFPENKSRVVSHGAGKQRSVYSGGAFLVDRVTHEAPSQGVGQQWHFLSMKQHRPWSQYKAGHATADHAIDMEQESQRKKQNMHGEKFVPILNRI